jgi:hypothetical protein
VFARHRELSPEELEAFARDAFWHLAGLSSCATRYQDLAADPRDLREYLLSHESARPYARRPRLLDAVLDHMVTNGWAEQVTRSDGATWYHMTVYGATHWSEIVKRPTQ